MNFAVTIVSPPGYVHAAAFHEVAETIHHGLRSLGHDSVVTVDGAIPKRRHIVLGSNLLPQYPMRLASDAILYNLEQIEVGSPWFRPELVDIFRRHVVWDYSKRNEAALAALGVRVAHILPVGYVKELTRLNRVSEPDIDVLFCGSRNSRRNRIIAGMKAAGLRVAAVFGVYGPERDALICRSKLLINIHFYDTRILEVVRISYWLANHCAVLSESSSDPAEDEIFADGVAFTTYEHLVERARALVDTPNERVRLARRGFEIMSARPAAEYLRAALEHSR